MKKQVFSLKYMILTYRLDMLWLPAAFWALFVIITAMIQNEPAGFPVCVAYLGTGLPLVCGILAAYSVLDDPALELQFATPRPVWMMLVERLGIILVLAAICALAYQVAVALLGVDLGPLGSIWARQFAWLVPTLAMMAVSSACAFANRHPAAGAAAVGMIWIFQILIRDWFLQDRVGQYVLLLMGSNYPDHPALRGNQLALSVLAVVLLASSWAMLRRQERYIG